jgi:hypothetical protein
MAFLKRVTVLLVLIFVPLYSSEYPRQSTMFILVNSGFTITPKT